RGALLVTGKDLRLGSGHLDVRDGDRDARAGGPVETGVLQVVQRCGGDDLRVALGQVVDDAGQFALVGNSLNPRVVLRQGLVEENLAQGGVHQCGLTLLPAFGSFPAGVRHEAFETDLDLGVQVQLVAVEVGVEGATNQRVKLDGLAFNKLRLERLDAEAVQGRCTVQQHGVFGDDLFEHVPDLRTVTLHHALGRLDVLGVVEVNQALHHERLEELQRHLLGQAALVQLQLRADDDDRTAGVVDALTEEVLAETALLALEHVAQGLQRTVARSGDRTAAAAIVKEAVNSFLKHALLVVDDDLRSTQVKQALEAVVAVDHTAVQVVEVGGREAATVQLDHRAQFRRDHRDSVKYHAKRAVVGGQERVDDLEALEGTGLALALAVGNDVSQQVGLGLHVE